MSTTNVSAGSATINAVISSGDTLNVFSGGTTVATAISGGDENVYSGGVAISTTVTGSSDGLVSGGLYVSGGTAGDTTVNAGGYEYVFTGGTANDTTVNAGGNEYVLAGGTAIGAIVNDGGTESVFSNGTDSGTTVNSGGLEYVFSGGTAVGTTISGGIEFVLSSGTTVGTTISGGIENVFSGGTASGVTIAASGTLDIWSGGTAADGILFSGNDATLIIGGTMMPTTPISGFAVSDSIILSDFAFAQSNTFSVSGDTVTVSDSGGDSYTLTIIGASNDSFVLSSAAGGGTELTAAPPAPTVTAALSADTGSSATDRITSNDALSGTAEANSTVTISNGATVLGTTTADATGAWSFMPTLGDGSYSLTAAETDAAGNTGTATIGFTLDTTAPTVTAALSVDTGSSATDGITSYDALRGTAEANSTVTISNGATVLGTTTADANGAWSLKPALADGSYSLTAAETDAAGNTGTATIGFTLDTTAPTVTAALSADTGSSATDGITSNDALTGTAEANSTVTISNGAIVLGTATADATGAWSFTPTGLSDGSYSLTAAETDAAGNTGTTTIAFTLDTTAPAAPTLTTGSEITNGNTTIIGSSGENGDTVTLFDGTTEIGTSTVTNGAWSIAVTTALGSNAITATQTDLAGNTSAASAPINIFVLQAPVAGISTTDFSSADLGAVLNQGATMAFVSGTEAVTLVDGTLSVGPDTNEATIQRLYEGLLGRSADAGGISGFDAQLTAGVSKATIATEFLSSNEYIADHGTQTDQQFVANLYQGLLGRAPEAAGLASWTSALAQGASRGDVASAIADSNEAKSHLAATTAQVFVPNAAGTLTHELYETGLGREVELTALPSYQAAYLTQTPSQIAAGIAASPEFLADHAGQSNSAYVTSLYQDGLGRAPDTAGLDYWTAQLNSGAATRSDVLLGIATSSEATAHLTHNLTA